MDETKNWDTKGLIAEKDEEIRPEQHTKYPALSPGAFFHGGLIPPKKMFVSAMSSLQISRSI